MPGNADYCVYISLPALPTLRPTIIISEVLGHASHYATPHVAGAASLLLAVNPTLTSAQVKDILLNTVDPVVALSGTTVTSRSATDHAL